MPRRKRDRADEIRDELEQLRGQVKRREIANEEFAAQSARLLNELQRLTPRTRFAKT